MFTFSSHPEWQKLSDEKWTRTLGDAFFIVEKKDDGWRLSTQIEYGPLAMTEEILREMEKTQKNIWHASSAQECFDVAQKYEDYLLTKEKFFNQRVFKKIVLDNSSGNGKRNLSGIELVARKTLDGELSVKAWHPDRPREEIGYLSTEYTGFLPTQVLGEITTNSASYIEKEWRGTGLCALMYNFQEEVFGLPPAPHGQNLVEAEQSDDAKRFWQKRAQHNRVPGLNDPEVSKRLAQMQPIADLFEMETTQLNRYRPELALVLAHHLETDLYTWKDIVEDEDYSSEILYSACKLDNSKILALAGLGKVKLADIERDVVKSSPYLVRNETDASSLLAELTAHISEEGDWQEFKTFVLEKNSLAIRILEKAGFTPREGLDASLENWRSAAQNIHKPGI